jgi:hypothetical protein
VRVRNNYDNNFIGVFTKINYKRPLGLVFLIHKKDRETILEEDKNYLPIV